MTARGEARKAVDHAETVRDAATGRESGKNRHRGDRGQRQNRSGWRCFRGMPVSSRDRLRVGPVPPMTASAGG